MSNKRKGPEVDNEQENRLEGKRKRMGNMNVGLQLQESQELEEPQYCRSKSRKMLLTIE